MINKRFVVIDLETTGNQIKNNDRIIQIGAVVLEGEKIVDRYTEYINPNRSIDPFIQNLTGIDEEMLEDAPSFHEIGHKVVNLLKNSYFVAHNSAFDLPFIKAELERCGFPLFQGPQIDTVELARILYPNLNGFTLSQLAEHFSITHSNPHRADSDAEVTAKIFQYFIQKLRDLPIQTLKLLLKLCPYLKGDLSDLLTEIISSRNEKENHLKRFDIIHDFAVLHTDYQFEETDHTVHSYDEIKTQVPELLKNAYNDYEQRTGQENMINQVDQAFEEETHLIVEAGTGIGKTMGYLLPAALYSKKHQSPIIISTYTITLQQQLIEKEVALLKKVLPVQSKVTVLKGRNHYICLEKFKQHFESLGEDNYDTILTKAQIIVWLTETETGDIDELNIPSGGAFFWNKIKSDSYTCQNHSELWESVCFFTKNIKKAHQSNIIITNHAYLIADLFSEQPVFPPYNQVIVDEAHHLEDVAIDQLGSSIDYIAFQHLLQRYLTTMKRTLTSKALSVEAETSILNIRAEVDDLFRLLRSFVLKKDTTRYNEIGRLFYVFKADSEKGILWESICEVVKRIRFMVLECNEQLKKIVTEKYLEKDLVELQKLNTDLNKISLEVKEMIIHDQKQTNITWLEAEEKGALNAAILYKQPFEIGNFLNDYLFSKKKSVILTSATLAVKGSFDYTCNRLGLNLSDAKQLQIPSPFSYKDQVKVMVPEDISLIQDVDEQTFAFETALRLTEIAQWTEGNMLVLFTSYSMLRQTYIEMKHMVSPEDFNIIAQGVSSGSRNKLIKNFITQDRSILFGTNSFWEGIDIPGKDLSCLVIVRLPFVSPDQPIFNARADLLKQKGQNVFNELSLPLAVLRFKQGFGRLIRTKTDKGIVFIFDKRITTSRYGRNFIKSIPPVSIETGNTYELINKMKDWL